MCKGVIGNQGSEGRDQEWSGRSDVADIDTLEQIRLGKADEAMQVSA